MSLRAALLDEHRASETLLSRLREDAHGRRLQAARRKAAWLAETMTAHLELEDRSLIPAYAALPQPVPNGSPEVLLRDHRMVRELLARMQQTLREDHPVRACAVLGKLAGVLEHHHLREERYLFPRLEACLEASALDALLRAHADEGQEPMPEGPDTVGLLPDWTGTGAVAELQWWLATGEVGRAREAAQAVAVGAPKAGRLRERVLAALAVDDVLAAWDASVLLAIVADLPATATARR